jgi:multicomponent Na+:H+ antiporter subunit E
MVFYSLLWWILSREGATALLFGTLAVAAATAASWRLGQPQWRIVRWARVPRFVGLFAWQSLRGGVDIALRAFSPHMRLQPGLVAIRLTLADEGMRTLLAVVVSLLPGTIAVRLEGERLLLHALDRRQPAEPEVRRFEAELSALVRTS